MKGNGFLMHLLPKEFSPSPRVSSIFAIQAGKLESHGEVHTPSSQRWSKSPFWSSLKVVSTFPKWEVNTLCTTKSLDACYTHQYFAIVFFYNIKLNTVHTSLQQNTKQLFLLKACPNKCKNSKLDEIGRD